MTEHSSAQCLVALMSGDLDCAVAPDGQASEGRVCAAFDADGLAETAAHMQRVILMGTIASGYVHDVNNLLTMIEHGAATVAEALPADHQARGDLELVLRSSAMISAVTRRLLAFVRRDPIEATSVDPRQLLEHSLPFLRRLLGSRVVVATDFDPETWRVWADVVSIEQILLNLLVNARNAMPGGGRVTISTANVYAGEGRGLRPGAYVRLSVADTGVGIGDSLIDRVFEPFVSEGGAGKGAGLGLATCRFLAECLGGGINVTSRPGEGTTFSIFLPRAGDEARASEE